MSDKTEREPAAVDHKPEYSKPQVETLGDLRELTEALAPNPSNDVVSGGSGA